MNSAEPDDAGEPQLPRVVFSIGDPNGIGPEIVLKSLDILMQEPAFLPVLAGDEAYLRNLSRELSLSVPWERVEILPAGTRTFTPSWGKVETSAGEFAWRSLQTASEICGQRKIPLLVTAPVNKESLRLAGFRFPGQTEFLAEAFSSANYCMAFLSDRFHLLLATIHIALSQVPGTLNQEDLYAKSCLFWEAVRRLESRPRIAFCGVNPHASEHGMFGNEERDIIEPVIARMQEEYGKDYFSGPFPPDTVFNKTLTGEYNAIIAMYHDQGLIPLKLLAFNSAVNTTLGLPVCRTSPGHGTAFDIAGKNQADPGAMIAAIKWGLRLAYPAGEPGAE